VNIGVDTSLSATVDTGYKLLSGGFYFDAPSTKNAVIYSVPNIDSSWYNPTQWQVKSRNIASSGSYTLYVYAIGIYDPDDNYEVYVTWNEMGNTRCPTISTNVGSGYVLTGGGGRINATGTPLDGENFLTASYSSSGSQWTCSSRGINGSSVNRGSLISYAIGIQPTGSGYVFTNGVSSDQEDIVLSYTPNTTCDIYRQMCGGGAQTFYLSGTANYLCTCYPSGLYTWSGGGSDLGTSTYATLITYAIELVLQQTS